MDTRQFQKVVLDFYKKHGRHTLPWRHTDNPYHILVSEMMLQQTQVDRVLPKYAQFLKRFPTLSTLARATTANVLTVWQGLGYNRRALALHRMAQIVVKEYRGVLPRTYDALVALPGIGPYTAGAVLAFAWNEPMLLIETNIRTVYLHHFFPRKKKVSDAVLENKITETLYMKNPRIWYWALMDYGAHLKKTIGNANVRSKHYVRQSTFKGSTRELRGAILKLLAQRATTEKQLVKQTERTVADVHAVLSALQKEGFIEKRGAQYSLCGK